MGGNKYGLNPEDLGKLATAINASYNETKSIGGSGVGGGFENLNLTVNQTGHAGVTHSFNEATKRWGWAWRTLVVDGQAMSTAVGQTEGLYRDTEEYASNAFKNLYADGMGNPALSEDDVNKQSWSTTLKDNPISQMGDIGHQFTSEGMQDTRDHYDHAGQVWGDTVKQGEQDMAKKYGLPAPSPGSETT